MCSKEFLRRYYARLQREGERLAGGLADLPQRAATYHHLFEHSGGNHVFPLIAAHGALWASGYFRFGMRLGACLSWQYALSPEVRRRRLAALRRFADAFREINRRVCVDSYAVYHFTARFGRHRQADAFVPAEVLDALNRLHAAGRGGRELTDRQRRAVFVAHFLNEQRSIVAPGIEAAVRDFDWPLVRLLALKPLIRFAYFPRRRWLWFSHFDDQQQRIERGLEAFDLAAAAGWNYTAASLRRYAVLPDAFFAGSARHFADLRASLLTGV